MSRKIFLTAQWKYLINITYAVDPAVLLPHLPDGLELDLIGGKAFVSFVAFEFREVKVKGIPIPFHRNFPEINLRFYVNKNGKRGVVFIKEFVPKYFVALIAKSFYNEPYSSIPMKSSLENAAGQISSKHVFSLDGRDFFVTVTAENKSFLPPADSIEHYFKEHEVGYGRDRKGNLIEYRVEHPIWKIYPIIAMESDLNFEKIYGKKWAFLDSEKPYNVLLAEGSEIKVFDKA